MVTAGEPCVFLLFRLFPVLFALFSITLEHGTVCIKIVSYQSGGIEKVVPYLLTAHKSNGLAHARLWQMKSE